MNLPRQLLPVWLHLNFLKGRDLSPLHVEILSLRKNIAKQEAHMNFLENDFWCCDPYGCCPGCGVPDWYKMEEQLARRRARLDQLEAKLCRDTQIRVDHTL